MEGDRRRSHRPEHSRARDRQPPPPPPAGFERFGAPVRQAPSQYYQQRIDQVVPRYNSPQQYNYGQRYHSGDRFHSRQRDHDRRGAARMQHPHGAEIEQRGQERMQYHSADRGHRNQFQQGGDRDRRNQERVQYPQGPDRVHRNQERVQYAQGADREQRGQGPDRVHRSQERVHRSQEKVQYLQGASREHSSQERVQHPLGVDREHRSQERLPFPQGTAREHQSQERVQYPQGADREQRSQEETQHPQEADREQKGQERVQHPQGAAKEHCSQERVQYPQGADREQRGPDRVQHPPRELRERRIARPEEDDREQTIQGEHRAENRIQQEDRAWSSRPRGIAMANGPERWGQGSYQGGSWRPTGCANQFATNNLGCSNQLAIDGATDDDKKPPGPGFAIEEEYRGSFVPWLEAYTRKEKTRACSLNRIDDDELNLDYPFHYMLGSTYRHLFLQQSTEWRFKNLEINLEEELERVFTTLNNQLPEDSQERLQWHRLRVAKNARAIDAIVVIDDSDDVQIPLERLVSAAELSEWERYRAEVIRHLSGAPKPLRHTEEVIECYMNSNFGQRYIRIKERHQVKLLKIIGAARYDQMRLRRLLPETANDYPIPSLFDVPAKPIIRRPEGQQQLATTGNQQGEQPTAEPARIENRQPTAMTAPRQGQDVAVPRPSGFQQGQYFANARSSGIQQGQNVPVPGPSGFQQGQYFAGAGSSGIQPGQPPGPSGMQQGQYIGVPGQAFAYPNMAYYGNEGYVYMGQPYPYPFPYGQPPYPAHQARPYDTSLGSNMNYPYHWPVLYPAPPYQIVPPSQATKPPPPPPPPLPTYPAEMPEPPAEAPPAPAAAPPAPAKAPPAPAEAPPAPVQAEAPPAPAEGPTVATAPLLPEDGPDFSDSDDDEGIPKYDPLVPLGEDMVDIEESANGGMVDRFFWREYEPIEPRKMLEGPFFVPLERSPFFEEPIVPELIEDPNYLLMKERLPVNQRGLSARYFILRLQIIVRQIEVARDEANFMYWLCNFYHIFATTYMDVPLKSIVLRYVYRMLTRISDEYILKKSFHRLDQYLFLMHYILAEVATMLMLYLNGCHVQYQLYAFFVNRFMTKALQALLYRLDAALNLLLRIHVDPTSYTMVYVMFLCYHHLIFRATQLCFDTKVRITSGDTVRLYVLLHKMNVILSNYDHPEVFNRIEVLEPLRNMLYEVDHQFSIATYIAVVRKLERMMRANPCYTVDNLMDIYNEWWYSERRPERFVAETYYPYTLNSIGEEYSAMIRQKLRLHPTDYTITDPWGFRDRILLPTEDEVEQMWDGHWNNDIKQFERYPRYWRLSNRAQKQIQAGHSEAELARIREQRARSREQIPTFDDVFQINSDVMFSSVHPHIRLGGLPPVVELFPAARNNVWEELDRVTAWNFIQDHELAQWRSAHKAILRQKRAAQNSEEIEARTEEVASVERNIEDVLPDAEADEEIVAESVPASGQRHLDGYLDDIFKLDDFPDLSSAKISVRSLTACINTTEPVRPDIIELFEIDPIFSEEEDEEENIVEASLIKEEFDEVVRIEDENQETEAVATVKEEPPDEEFEMDLPRPMEVCIKQEVINEQQNVEMGHVSAPTRLNIIDLQQLRAALASVVILAKASVAIAAESQSSQAERIETSAASEEQTKPQNEEENEYLSIEGGSTTEFELEGLEDGKAQNVASQPTEERPLQSATSIIISIKKEKLLIASQSAPYQLPKETPLEASTTISDSESSKERPTAAVSQSVVSELLKESPSESSQRLFEKAAVASQSVASQPSKAEASKNGATLIASIEKSVASQSDLSQAAKERSSEAPERRSQSFAPHSPKDRSLEASRCVTSQSLKDRSPEALESAEIEKGKPATAPQSVGPVPSKIASQPPKERPSETSQNATEPIDSEEKERPAIGASQSVASQSPKDLSSKASQGATKPIASAATISQTVAPQIDVSHPPKERPSETSQSVAKPSASKEKEGPVALQSVASQPPKEQPLEASQSVALQRPKEPPSEISQSVASIQKERPAASSKSIASLRPKERPSKSSQSVASEPPKERPLEASQSAAISVASIQKERPSKASQNAAGPTASKEIEKVAISQIVAFQPPVEPPLEESESATRSVALIEKEGPAAASQSVASYRPKERLSGAPQSVAFQPSEERPSETSQSATGSIFSIEEERLLAAAAASQSVSSQLPKEQSSEELESATKSVASIEEPAATSQNVASQLPKERPSGASQSVAFQPSEERPLETSQSAAGSISSIEEERLVAAASHSVASQLPQEEPSEDSHSATRSFASIEKEGPAAASQSVAFQSSEKLPLETSESAAGSISSTEEERLVAAASQSVAFQSSEELPLETSESAAGSISSTEEERLVAAASQSVTFQSSEELPSETSQSAAGSISSTEEERLAAAASQSVTFQSSEELPSETSQSAAGSISSIEEERLVAAASQSVAFQSSEELPLATSESAAGSIFSTEEERLVAAALQRVASQLPKEQSSEELQSATKSVASIEEEKPAVTASQRPKELPSGASQSVAFQSSEERSSETSQSAAGSIYLIEEERLVAAASQSVASRLPKEQPSETSQSAAESISSIEEERLVAAALQRVALQLPKVQPSEESHNATRSFASVEKERSAAALQSVASQLLKDRQSEASQIAAPQRPKERPLETAQTVASQTFKERSSEASQNVALQHLEERPPEISQSAAVLITSIEKERVAAATPESQNVALQRPKERPLETSQTLAVQPLKERSSETVALKRPEERPSETSQSAAGPISSIEKERVVAAASESVASQTLKDRPSEASQIAAPQCPKERPSEISQSLLKPPKERSSKASQSFVLQSPEERPSETSQTSANEKERSETPALQSIAFQLPKERPSEASTSVIQLIASIEKERPVEASQTVATHCLKEKQSETSQSSTTIQALIDEERLATPLQIVAPQLPNEQPSEAAASQSFVPTLSLSSIEEECGDAVTSKIFEEASKTREELPRKFETQESEKALVMNIDSSPKELKEIDGIWEEEGFKLREIASLSVEGRLIIDETAVTESPESTTKNCQEEEEKGASVVAMATESSSSLNNAANGVVPTVTLLQQESPSVEERCRRHSTSSADDIEEETVYSECADEKASSDEDLFISRTDWPEVREEIVPASVVEDNGETVESLLRFAQEWRQEMVPASVEEETAADPQPSSSDKKIVESESEKTLSVQEEIASFKDLFSQRSEEVVYAKIKEDLAPIQEESVSVETDLVESSLKVLADEQISVVKSDSAIPTSQEGTSLVEGWFSQQSMAAEDGLSIAKPVEETNILPAEDDFNRRSISALLKEQMTFVVTKVSEDIVPVEEDDGATVLKSGSSASDDDFKLPEKPELREENDDDVASVERILSIIGTSERSFCIQESGRTSAEAETIIKRVLEDIAQAPVMQETDLTFSLSALEENAQFCSIGEDRAITETSAVAAFVEATSAVGADRPVTQSSADESWGTTVAPSLGATSAIASSVIGADRLPAQPSADASWSSTVAPSIGATSTIASSTIGADRPTTSSSAVSSAVSVIAPSVRATQFPTRKTSAIASSYSVIGADKPATRSSADTSALIAPSKSSSIVDASLSLKKVEQQQDAENRGKRSRGASRRPSLSEGGEKKIQNNVKSSIVQEDAAADVASKQSPSGRWSRRKKPGRKSLKAGAPKRQYSIKEPDEDKEYCDANDGDSNKEVEKDVHRRTSMDEWHLSGRADKPKHRRTSLTANASTLGGESTQRVSIIEDSPKHYGRKSKKIRSGGNEDVSVDVDEIGRTTELGVEEVVGGTEEADFLAIIEEKRARKPSGIYAASPMVECEKASDSDDPPYNPKKNKRGRRSTKKAVAAASKAPAKSEPILVAKRGRPKGKTSKQAVARKEEVADETGQLSSKNYETKTSRAPSERLSKKKVHQKAPKVATPAASSSSDRKTLKFNTGEEEILKAGLPPSEEETIDYSDEQDVCRRTALAEFEAQRKPLEEFDEAKKIQRKTPGTGLKITLVKQKGDEPIYRVEGQPPAREESSTPSNASVPCQESGNGDSLDESSQSLDEPPPETLSYERAPIQTYNEEQANPLPPRRSSRSSRNVSYKEPDADQDAYLEGRRHATDDLLSSTSYPSQAPEVEEVSVSMKVGIVAAPEECLEHQELPAAGAVQQNVPQKEIWWREHSREGVLPSKNLLGEIDESQILAQEDQSILNSSGSDSLQSPSFEDIDRNDALPFFNEQIPDGSLSFSQSSSTFTDDSFTTNDTTCTSTTSTSSSGSTGTVRHVDLGLENPIEALSEEVVVDNNNQPIVEQQTQPVTYLLTPVDHYPQTNEYPVVVLQPPGSQQEGVVLSAPSQPYVTTQAPALPQPDTVLSAPVLHETRSRAVPAVAHRPPGSPHIPIPPIQTRPKSTRHAPKVAFGDTPPAAARVAPPRGVIAAPPQQPRSNGPGRPKRAREQPPSLQQPYLHHQEPPAKLARTTRTYPSHVTAEDDDVVGMVTAQPQQQLITVKPDAELYQHQHNDGVPGDYGFFTSDSNMVASKQLYIKLTTKDSLKISDWLKMRRRKYAEDKLKREKDEHDYMEAEQRARQRARIRRMRQQHDSRPGGFLLHLFEKQWDEPDKKAAHRKQQQQHSHQESVVPPTRKVRFEETGIKRDREIVSRVTAKRKRNDSHLGITAKKPKAAPASNLIRRGSPIPGFPLIIQLGKDPVGPLPPSYRSRKPPIIGRDYNDVNKARPARGRRPTVYQ